MGVRAGVGVTVSVGAGVGVGVTVSVGAGVGVDVGDGVSVGASVGVTLGAGVEVGDDVTVTAGVGSASAWHPINDSARMEKSAAKKMVWAKVRGFTTGCCSKQLKTQPL